MSAYLSTVEADGLGYSFGECGGVRALYQASGVRRDQLRDAAAG